MVGIRSCFGVNWLVHAWAEFFNGQFRIEDEYEVEKAARQGKDGTQ